METEEENFARLSAGIVQQALLNENATVLEDEVLLAILTLPENQQARATAIAVEEMQNANRQANAETKTKNDWRKSILDTRTKKDNAKKLLRTQLSGWLVSNECMSDGAVSEVKGCGLYDEDLVSLSPSIIIVCAQTAFGGDPNNDHLRQQEEDKLSSMMKHENALLHFHNSSLQTQVKKCVSMGTVFVESKNIARYIYGLNRDVFEKLIDEYDDNHEKVPATLDKAMAYTMQWYNNRISKYPSVSKVLGSTARSFAAYSTEETREQVLALEATPPADNKRCIFCDSDTRHKTINCFKWLDEKFIKQFISTNSARIKELTPYKRMIESRSATAAISKESVSSVAFNIELEAASDESTCHTVGSELLVHSICMATEDRAEFIDLEHDDHANISTIKKEDADIFADLLNKKGSLEGVVKNVFLPYEARGSLKFD